MSPATQQAAKRYIFLLIRHLDTAFSNSWDQPINLERCGLINVIIRSRLMAIPLHIIPLSSIHIDWYSYGLSHKLLYNNCLFLFSIILPSHSCYLLLHVYHSQHLKWMTYNNMCHNKMGWVLQSVFTADWWKLGSSTEQLHINLTKQKNLA